MATGLGDAIESYELMDRVTDGLQDLSLQPFLFPLLDAIKLFLQVPLDLGDLRPNLADLGGN
jgi:hypothetical protein